MSPAPWSVTPGHKEAARRESGRSVKVLLTLILCRALALTGAWGGGRAWRSRRLTGLVFLPACTTTSGGLASHWFSIASPPIGGRRQSTCKTPKTTCGFLHAYMGTYPFPQRTMSRAFTALYRASSLRVGYPVRIFLSTPLSCQKGWRGGAASRSGARLGLYARPDRRCGRAAPERGNSRFQSLSRYAGEGGTGGVCWGRAGFGRSSTGFACPGDGERTVRVATSTFWPSSAWPRARLTRPAPWSSSGRR